MHPKSVSVAPPIAWFVVAGQSGARGPADDLPYYACEQDHVWNWDLATDEIKVLYDPYDNLRGSVAPRLADYLRANGFASVGFIPVAQSGVASSAFVPPASLYLSAVAEVTAALAAAPAGSYLAGVIIYQGETDAIDNTGGATWSANWTAYVEGLETDLAAVTGVTLPIRTLVVRLPVTAVTGTPQPDWDDIRDGQDDFAAARPNPGTDSLIVQAPVAVLDNGLHLGMGADDTEGFRKLAVDSGAEIVGNWLP